MIQDCVAMHLRSTGPFGPFKSLEECELPRLTVLTGLNGSGKTKLLEAIAQGAVTASTSSQPVSKETVRLSQALEPKINLKFQLKEIRDAEHRAVAILHDQLVFRGVTQVRQSLVERVARALGKSERDLLDDEVRAFAYDHQAAGGNSEALDLARVCAVYLRRWSYQIRAQAMVAIGHQNWGKLASFGEPTTSPPPWKLVSALIAPFGFAVQGPDLTPEAAEADLTLTLIDGDKRPVSPDQLSGGEKCLIALALAQYDFSSGSSPKVMLLDESLAPLHPTVLKKAFATIREKLVGELGLHMIITTHSPTLVSLCDEDSLYETVRSGETLSLKKVSRSEALANLTADVPTIRFDPLNRRQVFVEAETDEFVYTRLFKALDKHMAGGASLQFIPASGGDQTGGCAKVRELVKELRKNGVTSCYGILDWDTKNVSDLTNGIGVLAQNRRYALENTILDPLLLLFALAGAGSQSREKHTLGKTQGELKVLPASPQELQGLVDKVVSAIQAKLCEGEALKADLMNVAYVGGFALNLPKQLLVAQSKDYLNAVMQAFPELAKGKPDQLMRDIADKFAPEWPEALPVEFLQVLQGIAQPIGGS